MAGPSARYEPEHVLGVGASGEVHLARDRETGTRVVLKRTKAGLPVSASLAERFRREAKVLAGLDHPRVLRLLDHGIDGDRPWFVYPYVEGESLHALLVRQGRLPLDQALVMATDVLEGLAHVHGLGLVHRDLKPANLLRTAEGRFLVLDFGLARELSDTAGLTGTGEFVGTPAYAAPGQIRAEDPDPRNDLYSLGLVLYESLAGANPMAGGSVGEILQRQLFQLPTPLHEAVPTVPRGLGLLVGRMLAKEPADRPASAGEVLARLRDPGPAGPAPVPLATLDGPTEIRRPPLGSRPPAPVPDAPRPRSAWPLAAGAGALGLALALALGAGRGAGPGEREPDPGGGGAPVDGGDEGGYGAFRQALLELFPPAERASLARRLEDGRAEDPEPRVAGQLAWWIDPRTPLRTRRMLDALGAWLRTVAAKPYDPGLAFRVRLATQATVLRWSSGLGRIEALLFEESIRRFQTGTQEGAEAAARRALWEATWREVGQVLEAHADGLTDLGGAYAPSLVSYLAHLRAGLKSPRMGAALDALGRVAEAGGPDLPHAATGLATGAQALVSRMAQMRTLRSEPACHALEALWAAGDGAPGELPQVRTGRLLSLLSAAAWVAEAWTRDRGRDPSPLLERICDRIEVTPDLDPVQAAERLDYLLTPVDPRELRMGVAPPVLAPALAARLARLRGRFSPPGTPAPR